MNKHSKFLFSLLLAQGVVLTGCGGGGSSANPEPVITPEARDGSWSLVWEDNFDGTAIDPEKWSHEVNCWGGGNNELQCYTDDPKNSYVEDGMLHIVPIEEPVSGPSVNQEDPAYPGTTVNREFSSARLRTMNKGDWKYGRFEVRAQVPAGTGMWSAAWMLPTDWVYGNWPLSGEIDIMEAVNIDAGGGNKTSGTLHYGMLWPGNVWTTSEYTPKANVSTNFHTYAIEWEEGEIRWYVDDTHFATQTSDGWYSYSYGGQEVGYQMPEGAAPFDQEFHLLLNVAVGGNLSGNPAPAMVETNPMLVDYVRVYQCDKDPATGKGCATNVDRYLDPLPGHPREQKVVSLYEDGPGTISVTVDDQTISNTLVTSLYQDPSAGGSVVSTPDWVTDSGETVWDLQFIPPSNASLSTGDMSSVEHANDGFEMQSVDVLGELIFEMLVVEIDPETELQIKVDSGYPNLSYAVIDTPAVGEWTTVSVRFDDLVPHAEGEVNYYNVQNPFVIEAVGGTAHVQLDDIRITCLTPCSVNPRLEGLTVSDDMDIYIDAVAAAWSDPGVDYYPPGTHGITRTDEAVEGRGNVLQFEFGPNFATMYIQSVDTQDLSAYGATGSLNFDLRIIEAAGNTDGFKVKADCVYPCGSIELPVPLPEGNDWVNIDIPIKDLKGLDLKKVNTPISFFPVTDQQNGVIFQMDNIRWVMEGSTEPGPEPEPTPANPVIDEDFFVFEDAVDAAWSDPGVQFYQAPNSEAHTFSVVADAVDPTNDVLQLTFGADGDWNSTMYIQTTQPKDLTAFADGNLTFDIKVVTPGATPGAFLIKGEGGGTTDPGTEHALTVNTDGAWHEMTVAVADLKIPDLSAVNTPISIWPDSDQNGVVFQLDNIRWELPAP